MIKKIAKYCAETEDEYTDNIAMMILWLVSATVIIGAIANHFWKAL